MGDQLWVSVRKGELTQRRRRILIVVFAVLGTAFFVMSGLIWAQSRRGDNSPNTAVSSPRDQPDTDTSSDNDNGMHDNGRNTTHIPGEIDHDDDTHEDGTIATDAPGESDPIDDPHEEGDTASLAAEDTHLDGKNITTAPGDSTTVPEESNHGDGTGVDSVNVTYAPGELTVQENGLILSTGLSCRIVAEKKQPVVGIDGTVSSETFHRYPDAGACFPHPDGPEHGWAYLSNSEHGEGKGGVGAIYFDSDGQILRYELLLNGTTDNCGGGKTPWGTWISGEESTDNGKGLWEVHPWKERPPQLTALANRSGEYESFAYDIRDQLNPKFFFTEDAKNGPVVRFTPNPDSVTSDQENMWQMLYAEGYTREYLFLEPVNSTHGTFNWTEKEEEGQASALANFRNVEGIDCRDGILYFVSKVQRELFVLHLDAYTYEVSSTKDGAFTEPDQIVQILDEAARRSPLISSNERPAHPVLYFTEDGRHDYSGIHARDVNGRYFTIVESMVEIDDVDETSGLAFSPDRRHMYFALQKVGILYDVWRADGLPFDGAHLDVKYHSNSSSVARH